MKTVYVKPKTLNRCEACHGIVIDGGVAVQSDKTLHMFCSLICAGVWAIENKRELTYIGYFSAEGEINE